MKFKSNLNSSIALFVILCILNSCKKDNDSSTASGDTGIKITTSDVTSITSSEAQSGGNINEDGGSSISQRGLCWSTNSNPDTSDFYSNNGTGSGSFNSSITTLSANTKYFVRAYAVNSKGI